MTIASSSTRVPRELSHENGFGRDVLAAYREAVRRYADELWVTGVSIGVKEIAGDIAPEAGPVIAIHIRRKQELARVRKVDRIPSQILGIPTDVIEGTYTPSSGAVAAAAGFASPVFPLRPGSSFARHDGSAATLGGVLRDEAGVRFLLSAGHALREGGRFRRGDLMVHPSPADSRTPVGVARYEDVHLGLDAGIARLEATIQVNNRALLSSRQILSPRMPRRLDILEKSGNATHITRGQVRNIGAFGRFFPAMRIVSLPGDTGPISLGGDSGATWYDATTFVAKGLHVAIDLNSNPPSAIATLTAEIARQFRLTWE
ncbi:MAG TPA: hypothetical protein VEK79_20780 [Thermoanaerobaculia bacterium]|nr:hypothetical protein [Thermoanaerobaculia bacterium]